KPDSSSTSTCWLPADSASSATCISLRVMQRDESRELSLPAARSSMRLFVTFGAQRDQVLFLIATGLTPELEVVHLQLLHATASLASPAIALQHLPMQFAVAVRLESESRTLAAHLLHEALRLTSERKASCCGLGRNL